MTAYTLPTIETSELSQEEGAKVLNEASTRLLGIPGLEFMRLWDANEPIPGDHATVMKVAMLIPLAR